MSDIDKEIIQYRINRAYETLEEARIMVQHKNELF